MISDKWDHRFMRLAKEVSSWSKDPSSQIGSVIVNDERRILGTGYNGFPKTITDDERLRNREEKYPLIIHSEMNAILNCLRSGIPVQGSTIYVYGLPVCNECCKNLVQAGVTRVVTCIPETVSIDRWRTSIELSEKLFKEANVQTSSISL